MNERDSMEQHIQLLIDMNEPSNAQDRIIVWGYSEITRLEADLKQCESNFYAMQKDRGEFKEGFCRLQAENAKQAATIEALEEAAQAVVDSVNAWGTTGEMYTIDVDDFETLEALLPQQEEEGDE